jgi:hypothetical protein
VNVVCFLERNRYVPGRENLIQRRPIGKLRPLEPTTGVFQPFEFGQLRFELPRHYSDIGAETDKAEALLGPSHHVVVVPANQASVEVNERGGAIKLVEEGWFQQKLADSAYATFKKIDSGEKISVGVNRYVDGVSNA